MTLKAGWDRKAKWKEKNKEKARQRVRRERRKEQNEEKEGVRETRETHREKVETRDAEERAGGRKGRVWQVATLEEDRLFGQKVEYPTSRRPIDYWRELSTDPWETVEKWFSTFGVMIGLKGNEAIQSPDRKTAKITARLFHTWRDLFVEDMVEMPATDLATHTIPTGEDAVPRRARYKLYTPRERNWMDRNIPKILEAGIIHYSVSPWCHKTKFVPKKDGDLRMVLSRTCLARPGWLDMSHTERLRDGIFS